MECLACKEGIDDDSAFCDMCGIELSVCEHCRVPIAGKWCSKCGGQRVLASTLSAAAAPAKAASVAGFSMATGSGVITSATTAAPEAIGSSRAFAEVPATAPASKLRLRNLNLELDLVLSESTLIGRTTGPLSTSFGKFEQISSKHCLLERDGANGWRVTDLGSRNSTFYNNHMISKNQPQPLSNESFLKIANIEFFVSIE